MRYLSWSYGARLHIASLVASLMAMVAVAAADRTTLNAADLELRCDAAIAPANIDVPSPRLSWAFGDATTFPRGTSVGAFRVRVATSVEALASETTDLWDSGRIEADHASGVSYDGRLLSAGATCFWSVELWDQAGKSLGASAPATWSSGLLTVADWQPARWITLGSMTVEAGRQPGSVRLRGSFTIAKRPRRAMLYVTGLGHYELLLNGARVDDALLAPGWTDYRKTVLYDAFDVTAQLHDGGNALDLLLGNGMYHIEPTPGRYVKFTNSFGAKQAIALLRIENDDGSVQFVGTDSTWQAAAGPITYSNVFGGEDYVATTDSAVEWQAATETNGPGGALRGHSAEAPSIRAIETLRPIAVRELAPGVSVYDLGQNASMMPRLRVRGARGASVRIIPAELLGEDGRVDRASCVQDAGGPAWWQFTLGDGDAAQTFEPKFFYQGARYLQVETFAADGASIDARPVVESLEGIVVHSSAEPIGTFECSNDLFNRIYRLVRWAQRSNMMSVMTDCPQREKLGWLEQLHLNGPSLRYNFRLDGLYTKEMNDMADAQLVDGPGHGFVPNIAPEYFLAHTDKLTDPFRNSPEWGSSFVIAPWQQYLFTGDDTLLRRHYAAMVRYVDFLSTIAKDNIIEQGLGDWYDLGPKPPWGSQLTPPPFTATAIYFWDLQILRDVALHLGKPEEAAAFGARADAVRAAFNERFFDAAHARYASGSQCTSALPLVLDLCPPEHRSALLETLIADIRARGNGLSAGDVGYRFVLRALADAGRSDVVFDMNSHSDRPGYGMQLARGATALTEKWDASVGKFGSQNHFMLGQINEWFFHDLAGVQPDPDAPGFESIVIKPAMVGDVTWVNCTYRSTRGLIRTAWRRVDSGVDGRVELNVTIPPNCRATVHVPTTKPSSVREAGAPIAGSADVRHLRDEAGASVLSIGSGTYRFTAD